MTLALELEKAIAVQEEGFAKILGLVGTNLTTQDRVAGILGAVEEIKKSLALFAQLKDYLFAVDVILRDYDDVFALMDNLMTEEQRKQYDLVLANLGNY